MRSQGNPSSKKAEVSQLYLSATLKSRPFLFLTTWPQSTTEHFGQQPTASHNNNGTPLH
jgi:hypothetical protein